MRDEIFNYQGLFSKSTLERFVLVITKLDPKFKDEVLKVLGGQNIKRCFQRGTCNVRCPVRGIEDACMGEETAENDKAVLVIGTYFQQES